VSDDSPALFVSDILAKNKHRGDAREAARVADAVGPALEWLRDRHGIPFEVLERFLYPAMRDCACMPTRRV
jgi:fumarate reductase flavoprotein subunit